MSTSRQSATPIDALSRYSMAEENTWTRNPRVSSKSRVESRMLSSSSTIWMLSCFLVLTELNATGKEYCVQRRLRRLSEEYVELRTDCALHLRIVNQTTLSSLAPYRPSKRWHKMLL